MRHLIVGAEAVGEVLPEAIAAATARRREATGVALEPILGEALRGFARREATLLGEVLAPSIGAAVRKAVADAFAVLLQRFNEALERSMSVRSIQWRIEARRTGRPFAEVVLLHTLVYRVEQALLIHAPSGIVLQHVVAEGVPAQDPDQVAAMLDAIDAFSRDALRQPPEAHLEELAFGDLRVWIDWDPQLAVALVVRGVAPRQLGELVRETREHILLGYQAELAAFAADVTPFVPARPSLEACLREVRRPPARSGQKLLIALGVLCAIGIVLLGVRAHRRHAAVEAAAASLRREPGLVVSRAERRHGRIHLAGLRDPLAPDPAAVLARDGRRAELSFTPFQSLDPRIVLARARRTLAPPPSVAVALAGGTLALSGEAPQAWIDRAQLIAPTVAGVDRVERSGLRSSERMAALREAVAALEASAVPFAAGSERLSGAAPEAVARVAPRVERVHALAAGLGIDTCIVVEGRADRSGSDTRNAALLPARADAVRAALVDRGVTPGWLRAQAGMREGEGPAARTARFIVQLGRSCAAGAP